MTNKQIADTWDKILRKVCGCYPDAVGNRPCDNGAICDRCDSQMIQEIFEREIGIR